MCSSTKYTSRGRHVLSIIALSFLFIAAQLSLDSSLYSRVVSDYQLSELSSSNNSKSAPQREARVCARGIGSFGRSVFWPLLSTSDALLYEVIAKQNRVVVYFNTHQYVCPRPKCSFKNDRFEIAGLGTTSWFCEFAVNGSLAQVPTAFSYDPHGHGFKLTCDAPPEFFQGEEVAYNVSVAMTAERGSGVFFLRYPPVPFCRYPLELSAPLPGAKPSQLVYPVKLGACAMVTTRHAPPRQILEWIAYHKLQGFDHFYIFPEENPCHLREVLQPLIATGLVEIVDFGWPVHGFRHQQSQIASCLERYRGMARWVGFFDVDEFFQPLRVLTGNETLDSSISNTTVLDLVVKAEEQGHTALQVRSIWFEWANQGLFIENSTHRAFEAHWPGREKCIVRPEFVDIMGIHEVTRGARMHGLSPTTELRLNHYREVVPSEYDVELNVVDTSMQVYAPGVRGELSRAYGASWESTFQSTFRQTRSANGSLPMSQCAPGL